MPSMVTATRYVVPLCEGGSVSGSMESDAGPVHSGFTVDPAGELARLVDAVVR